MALARSSFYYKPDRSEAKLRETTVLRGRIERIALEHSRYGYRRITAQLKQDGFKVNRKRVLRIMKESDLLCRPLKGFVVTTDSKHRFPVYPNLYQLQRPDQPNRIWVADITYIRLEHEFVYLAVILDAFSRRVIGWELSDSLEAGLVIAALEKAIRARKPAPGCLHHSDRGVQYACYEYTDLLKRHGFQISMSRKGNPYDNAVMESFFKTLKNDEVHLDNYRTQQEARAKIARFLDQVYNKKRLHSALGYLPPAVFELKQKHTPTHVLTAP